MHIKKYFILIIVLLQITFTLCCKKKYPEGPRLSFRTPTTRLIGDWSINKVLINNKDAMNVIDSLKVSYITIRRSDEPIGLQPLSIKHVDQSVFSGLSNNSWYLTTSHEDTLNVVRPVSGIYGYIGPLPAYIADSENWQILKLKYDEVWLLLINSQNRYEVHLKIKEK